MNIENIDFDNIFKYYVYMYLIIGVILILDCIRIKIKRNYINKINKNK